MGRILPALHGIAALYLAVRSMLGGAVVGPISTAWILIYLALLLAPELRKERTYRVALLIAAAIIPAIPLGVDVSFRLLLSFHLVRLAVVLGVSVPVGLGFGLLSLPLIPVDQRLEGFFLSVGVAAVFIVERTLADRTSRGERIISNLERDKRSLEADVTRLSRAEADREFLARLEERKRIAQKLHDGLGHVLAGSITQLEAAATLLDTEPLTVGTMLDTVTGVLRKGMDDVRTELRALRPAVDDLGKQAVVTMLRDFESRTGIPAGIHLATEMPNATIWEVITENLREALTNTLKYAQASRVDFSVAAMKNLYRAELHDDGNGVAGGRPHPGMGLTGMEERMRAVGGTLIVDGSTGFSVVMIFPRERA